MLLEVVELLASGALGLLVLAGLNLVVLSEGIYCFYVLLNEQPNGRLSISLFYGAALSCLSVAMFYFLTGYLTMGPCPLYFLETAPGVLYLVTGLISPDVR